MFDTDFIREIAHKFLILKQADKLSVEVLDMGHINHTYIIRDEIDTKSYILQKINTLVFPNPEILASNMKVVSAHLHQKKLSQKDFESLSFYSRRFLD